MGLQRRLEYRFHVFGATTSSALTLLDSAQKNESFGWQVTLNLTKNVADHIDVVWLN